MEGEYTKIKLDLYGPSFARLPWDLQNIIIRLALLSTEDPVPSLFNLSLVCKAWRQVISRFVVEPPTKLSVSRGLSILKILPNFLLLEIMDIQGDGLVRLCSEIHLPLARALRVHLHKVDLIQPEQPLSCPRVEHLVLSSSEMKKRPWLDIGPLICTLTNLKTLWLLGSSFQFSSFATPLTRVEEVLVKPTTGPSYDDQFNLVIDLPELSSSFPHLSSIRLVNCRAHHVTDLPLLRKLTSLVITHYFGDLLEFGGALSKITQLRKLGLPMCRNKHPKTGTVIRIDTAPLISSIHWHALSHLTSLESFSYFSSVNIASLISSTGSKVRELSLYSGDGWNAETVFELLERHCVSLHSLTLSKVLADLPRPESVEKLTSLRRLTIEHADLVFLHFCSRATMLTSLHLISSGPVPLTSFIHLQELKNLSELRVGCPNADERLPVAGLQRLLPHISSVIVADRAEAECCQLP